MSPASYRAAPPRVGNENLTRARRDHQIAGYAALARPLTRSWIVCLIHDMSWIKHTIQDLWSSRGQFVVVGVTVAVGVGVTVNEPEGAAAAARASASLSRFCASPYAAKSPALSAASPSAYAF